MRETQEWIWRAFKVILPADWELLQFSRNFTAGRCAFADRYQYRFELDWRVLPGAPDMARMMTDYQAKLTADGTLAQAKLTDLPGWHGLSGRQGDAWTTRYGRFFPDASCLVEAVAICPGSRDEPLERSVVTSIGHEGVRDGIQRWKAFGMAVLAPAACALDDCTVQPAHGSMTFSSRKRNEELLCQRSGMLDQWLAMPVEDWLAAQAPPDVLNATRTHDTIAGHAIQRIQGGRKPGGFLRKRRAFAAAAWTCPRDGRLYHAAHSVATSAAHEGGRPGLSCCPSCEVRL